MGLLLISTAAWSTSSWLTWVRSVPMGKTANPAIPVLVAAALSGAVGVDEVAGHAQGLVHDAMVAGLTAAIPGASDVGPGRQSRVDVQLDPAGGRGTFVEDEAGDQEAGPAFHTGVQASLGGLGADDRVRLPAAELRPEIRPALAQGDGHAPGMWALWFAAPCLYTAMVLRDADSATAPVPGWPARRSTGKCYPHARPPGVRMGQTVRYLLGRPSGAQSVEGGAADVHPASGAAARHVGPLLCAALGHPEASRTAIRYAPVLSGSGR